MASAVGRFQVLHGQDLEDEIDAEETHGPARRSQLTLVWTVGALYFFCLTFLFCVIKNGKTPIGYSDDDFSREPSAIEILQSRCDQTYADRGKSVGEESARADVGHEDFPKTTNGSSLSSEVRRAVEKKLAPEYSRRSVSVTYYVCGSESAPQSFNFSVGIVAVEKCDDGGPLTQMTVFVDRTMGLDVAIGYRLAPDNVRQEEVNKVYRLFVEAMKVCLPMPILCTLAVYCYLPQLRNLQGKIIVCKLLSNLVNCLWPWFVHEEDPSFVLVWSCMAGITWTTIICYDLWAAVSGRLPTSSPENGNKFVYYSLIGWGHPVSLVLLVYIVHSNVRPDFKLWMGLIVFVVYIFLNVLNLMFFVFTVKSIKAHNSRHLKVIKEGRQGGAAAGGFYFYFRICSLMGVLSFVFDNVYIIMIGFVDHYNGLHNAVLLGCSFLDKILTLVILVCNKRVFGFLGDKRKSKEAGK